MVGCHRLSRSAVWRRRPERPVAGAADVTDGRNEHRSEMNGDDMHRKVGDTAKICRSLQEAGPLWQRCMRSWTRWEGRHSNSNVPLVGKVACDLYFLINLLIPCPYHLCTECIILYYCTLTSPSCESTVVLYLSRDGSLLRCSGGSRSSTFRLTTPRGGATSELLPDWPWQHQILPYKVANAEYIIDLDSAKASYVNKIFKKLTILAYEV